MFLTRPTTDLKTAYIAFYNEWKESGEEMIPWVIAKNPSDFEGMVQSLIDADQGIGLSEGWVPDSTYWLVSDEGKVVGVVNIRHELTKKLYNEGGHIGYGICPSERKKGYATKLLALSLEKAKELGIEEVLIVCDKSNVGSKKTIVKNGGKPGKDFTEENGNVINRFWIKLESENKNG